jgi:hypothetical protein
MINQPVQPVLSFVRSLFQRGLETYDGVSKTSHNVGGAQIFQMRNWKGNQSRIKFNNPAFGKVLAELAATLYTVNRVKLDQSGNPVKLESGRNQRINNGLMLYMQYGEDGTTARHAVSRIIEACPELTGNIGCVADLIGDCEQLSVLQEVKVPLYGGGELQDMNPFKCVMLAVTSGSENSSQYWSFVNTRTVSRRALDDHNKVDITGLEGII